MLACLLLGSIDGHMGRPAQASLSTPDWLRARAGRHYGLRLWPSTSPRLIFRAAPVRGTTVGTMGHPARASPRPDESGQRRTSGRQESGGGGGDRSVDSAGEGGGREEVAGGGGGSRCRRSTGGEKEEEVVVAPLRRRPLCHGRRSSATADHIAALGGRSSPIVAPGAPPSSRPELLHHCHTRFSEEKPSATYMYARI
jgi:hypothetical protein